MLGQEFKFVIDDGRQYLCSERYFQKRDPFGNSNNQYDPRRINQPKRRKNKNAYLHNSYPKIVEDDEADSFRKVEENSNAKRQ